MYVINLDGTECTTWAKIKAACFKENQACIDQPSETRLLTEPLFSLVGSIREGLGPALILGGTSNIQGISQDMRDILKALHMCCLDIDQPFPRFTMDSYQDI